MLLCAADTVYVEGQGTPPTVQTMRSKWPAIAAILAPLVLVGCASSMSSADVDACGIHASWASEGSPADDWGRLAESLDATDEADSDSQISQTTRDLVGSLQAADAELIDAESAALASACRDAGWTHTEG